MGENSRRHGLFGLTRDRGQILHNDSWNGDLMVGFAEIEVRQADGGGTSVRHVGQREGFAFVYIYRVDVEMIKFNNSNQINLKKFEFLKINGTETNRTISNAFVIP